MVATVTNSGLSDVVAALIVGDAMKYVGWGGGAGQDETDADLASAFSEGRAIGSMAAATTNTTDDTVRIVGTLTATTPRSVTEVGVFMAAVGDEMAIYGDFPVVNLAVNDVVTFTIDVVVDQA